MAKADRVASAPLDVFIVAGEQSGDELGGALMQALQVQAPQGVAFRGVGGAAMTRNGLKSLFPMSDIAVMGFLPVIARLPILLARIRATADAIIAAPPDVLVIIDSPDFTHRVARRVRKHVPALPIVDYVSPTVWAWRPGRAPRMRAYVDHLLALLPFEPQAHVRLGGPACTYVGHPLIERLDVLRPSLEEARRRDAVPPTLVVLPGSRRSEVERLMDIFGEAVTLLVQEFPGLDIVLPAVAHVEALVRDKAQHWKQQPRIVLGEAEKFAAFRQARAALAASGTVTLELALSGVPTTVAYRVSKAEEWIARRLITTQFAALPNIILGEGVLPEFIQDACTPQALAQSTAQLLRNGPERTLQVKAFDKLADTMILPDGQSPSTKAAEVILQQIARN
ncbi:MAG: lpxB [Hyphomicrobiales bacterium]|nr:lpxB [Hyphomicrobiales bacterium]